MSPLLFVLALMPVLLVLREVKSGYNLGDLLRNFDHLLFMDDLNCETQINTLVNTVWVFSKDIGMEFRVRRCATVIMKRGIISRSEAMQQHNIEVIKYIGEGYKYLDILETDKLKTLEREKSDKRILLWEIEKSEVKTKLW